MVMLDVKCQSNAVTDIISNDGNPLAPDKREAYHSSTITVNATTFYPNTNYGSKSKIFNPFQS